MSNILYYLFWSLINIDLFILLLIVLGFLLSIATHSKIGRSFLNAGVVILILTGVLPTARWMGAYLENYYPQYKGRLPEDVKGIIILAGGFDRLVSAGRDRAVFNLAGGRVFEGAALAKDYPHLKVLYTGGGFIPKGGIPEGEMARKYFQTLGIDSTRLILEKESQNTEENASKSFALIRPQADERWVLVTSAFHMPRAVSLFRAKGWNIIPYPVDYHTDGRFPLLSVPNLQSTYVMWAAAVKEWAGFFTNWIYKITPTLLPEKN